MYRGAVRQIFQTEVAGLLLSFYPEWFRYNKTHSPSVNLLKYKNRMCVSDTAGHTRESPSTKSSQLQGQTNNGLDILLWSTVTQSGLQKIKSTQLLYIQRQIFWKQSPAGAESSWFPSSPNLNPSFRHLSLCHWTSASLPELPVSSMWH